MRTCKSAEGLQNMVRAYAFEALLYGVKAVHALDALVAAVANTAALLV